jgi:hypothetical protein
MKPEELLEKLESFDRENEVKFYCEIYNKFYILRNLTIARKKGFLFVERCPLKYRYYHKWTYDKLISTVNSQIGLIENYIILESHTLQNYSFDKRIQ